jgi:isopentenyl-diphosphate Delta-isomerase
VTELLYCVTPEDVVLGSVDRDTAHAKGALHRSGVVFLRRSDGRILIQHRSPSKRIFPDCYDCSAAFHVTFGETYEQAAVRELGEETGVSAPVHWVGKFTHHDPPEDQIVAVFTCESDTPIQANPTESVGSEFLTKTEVDAIVRSRRVTPWLRDGWPLARDQL